MAHIVAMPKQGLQMTEGTIIEWYVKEGGEVKAGRPLFSMETDKLTIDIDSEFDGALLKILEKEGSVVPITAPIALIGIIGEDMQALSMIGGPQAESDKDKDPERTFISPRARKKASELAVDYKTLNGTGPNGLIIEQDIVEHMAIYGKNKDIVSAAATNSITTAYQQITVDMSIATRFTDRLALSGSDMGMAALVTKIIYAAYDGCHVFRDAVVLSGYGFNVSEGKNAEMFIEALPLGDAAALSFGKISDRRAMSLSLTYDKRFIGSDQAGKFLSELKQLIGDPYLAFI